MAKSEFISITSAGAIEHILEFAPQRLHFISAPGGSRRFDHIQQLAKSQDVQWRVSKSNDICAEVFPFEYTPWEKVLKTVRTKDRATLLLLDHLKDPQNFGAICRTADGLGIDAVVIPKDRSVSVSAGVYHASVGAVETLPICKVTNLGNAMRELKEEGFWNVGASLGEKATVPWKTPDFEKCALLMGAEFEGLSESLAKQCDWLVRIPLAGKMPSLNVSASSAILMYEMFRPSEREA